MARLSKSELDALRSPQPGLGRIEYVRITKRHVIIYHARGRVKLPRDGNFTVNPPRIRMPSGMLIPVAMLRNNGIPVIFE